MNLDRRVRKAREFTGLDVRLNVLRGPRGGRSYQAIAYEDGRAVLAVDHSNPGSALRMLEARAAIRKLKIEVERWKQSNAKHFP